jgi:hypothetical protein
MVLPNLELLGMIGALGVASVAAWSSANLNMRLRLMERDIDELHDEMQVVRRRSSAQLQMAQREEPAPFAPAPAWQPAAAHSLWEPTPAPVFQPLYAHYADSAANQPRADWPANDHAQPDLSELAAQLGAQSRHTMEFVLSPTLDLGGASVDAGAASEQQEQRLLRWAASVPSAS